jgi:predicted metal-binding membrane protein
VLTKVAETVLKRDRIVVIAGLAAVTALAWVYVLQFASCMTGMNINNMEMSKPITRAWRSGDFLLTFMMWAVMMVAMMTPSATPMILMFARVNRQRQAEHPPLPATIVFLLGYLMVWSSFSAGATVVQWSLHSAALLSPEIISVSPILGGILLILAGVYQFTPLKHVCLSQCRTPLGFLMTEWREGTKGALIMGVRHGVYCVGCCWLLMTLLFVAGVMNLLWVALIAGYVLVEKVVPAGQWVSRAIGLLAVGWGVWLLIRALGA